MVKPGSQESQPSKYQSAFEQSRDAIMFLDRDRFLDCNPATLEMFRVPDVQTFCALHPAELSPEYFPDGNSSEEAADARIQEAYVQGRAFFEWQHRRWHGEEFSAEVLLSRIDLEDGPVLQAVVRDISDRKQAEETLRRKSEEQALLLESVPTQIWYLTDVETYGAVNQAHADFCGLSREEMEYRKLWDFLPEDKARVCRDSNIQVFQSEEQIRTEEWLHNASGEQRLVGIIKTPKLDASGNVEYVVCSGSDITERKQAEEQLKKRTWKLESVLSSVKTVSLIVTDLEGIIEDISSGVEDIFGYDREEMIGRHVSMLHTEEEAARLSEYVTRLLQGQGFSVETSLIRKSGEKFPALFSVQPVFDDQGQVISTLGISFDITERKQAENTIENERAYLSAVIDNLEEAIVICDAEGRIARFNETARRLHGLPEDPIPPEQWAEHYDLYQEDGITPLPLEDIPLFRALQGERVLNAEIAVAPKHKGPYYLVCSGQALTDETGKITGSVVAMHDITERKQMEETLRRSENYYRALFESSATAIFIINEDTTIALANSYFEEIFGYSREEVEGKKSWTEFVHPEDVAWTKEYHYLRRREPYAAPRQYECRLIDRHGHKRNFFLAVDMIPETSQSIASGLDITEQKKAKEALRESERKYRQEKEYLDNLIQNSADAVVILDEHGRIVRWNKQAQEASGYSYQDVRGTHFSRFHADGEQMERMLSELRKKGSIQDYEIPLLTKNGREIPCSMSVSTIHDTENKLIGSINILRDLTEWKQAEEALHQSENYYRTLFETTGTAMCVYEQDTVISLVNSKFENLSGYSKQELEGKKSWIELIHLDDLDWMKQNHYLRLQDPDKAEKKYECRCIVRNGEVRNVLLSVDRIPGTSRSIASCIDITEHKRAEEKVYSLAYFDKLTGLPNRELFLEFLEQAVSRSELFEEHGAVLLVNIEKLKSVNDTLGEEAGNELIREVGRRIWDTLRERDTVARVAGDEFMILAEGIDTGENARNLGLRVLERIRGELELSHRRIYPEASIGFTLFPHGARDSERLIKQADMALSGAKKSASWIQQFTGDEEGISREFHLEQDLKSALANEEFWLCYQPQIDLQSGKTVGLEALIRWSHPQRGPVSPGEFIPLLVHSGMIASVDAWVVRRVCEQLRSWRDAGFLVRASVNLSAQDLVNDSILGVVSSALEESRLPTDALSVELTETDLMDNVERASGILRTLSGWGIQVALDDFGKGYSSLRYLQRLPIHVIKIDKEFVAGMLENEDSLALVQTIIAMALNMGKKVLAEGVERREQWEKLLQLGCDCGQGFLWGRPQMPEALKF